MKNTVFLCYLVLLLFINFSIKDTNKENNNTTYMSQLIEAELTENIDVFTKYIQYKERRDLYLADNY